MTDFKECKVWGIVDKDGYLVWDDDGHAIVRKTKVEAVNELYFPGERVVRVTVRIEE